MAGDPSAHLRAQPQVHARPLVQPPVTALGQFVPVPPQRGGHPYARSPAQPPAPVQAQLFPARPEAQVHPDAHLRIQAQADSISGAPAPGWAGSS